jgi:dTDP-glucose pyrophosphorylase/CBS domain-containing protein
LSADLTDFCIGPTDTILQAMRCMDSNGIYIALVLDEEGRLLDTVTDGDVRRAILAELDLDSAVSALSEYKSGSPYPAPVTALVGSTAFEMIDVMQKREIRHLPLVDARGRVVSVVTLDELTQAEGAPLHAVIMAGGFGTRLRPLTDEVPKPMLPVGDKPLMEHIVAGLQAAGIKSLSVTTHYKGELIEEHFKDGHDFGVEINYVEEDEPLGTAGALSLLERTDGPLLVINGDIMTRIDFGAMLSFHREHAADMTVGIRQLKTTIPFGVVESQGVDIVQISEKPTMSHFISAGVYLLDPDVIALIPAGEPYDMPDLINTLAADGKKIVGFPIREYWLDIGRLEDYEAAQFEAGSVDKHSRD